MWSLQWYPHPLLFVAGTATGARRRRDNPQSKGDVRPGPPADRTVPLGPPKLPVRRAGLGPPKLPVRRAGLGPPKLPGGAAAAWPAGAPVGRRRRPRGRRRRRAGTRRLCPRWRSRWCAAPGRSRAPDLVFRLGPPRRSASPGRTRGPPCGLPAHHDRQMRLTMDEQTHRKVGCRLGFNDIGLALRCLRLPDILEGEGIRIE